MDANAAPAPFAELVWGGESQQVNVSLSRYAVDPSALVYGWGEPDSEGTPVCRGAAILAVDLSAHAFCRMRMECVLRYCCSNPLDHAALIGYLLMKSWPMIGRREVKRRKVIL